MFLSIFEIQELREGFKKQKVKNSLHCSHFLTISWADGGFLSGRWPPPGVGWGEGRDIQHGGSVEGTKASPTPSPQIPPKRKENHSFASPAVLSKN